MWIIWPFRKKNFGLAWTVCADFRRLIDPNIGKFIIQDETVLPYPKRTIFESICVLLLTETDHKLLELINLCAFELAFFQKGVGKDPAYPLGINRDDFDDAPAHIDSLDSPFKANPAGKERYDRFKHLRDAEWERMKAAMSEIKQKNIRLKQIPA